MIRTTDVSMPVACCIELAPARRAAKKPDERFASAAEIRALLDGWRREKGFGDEDQASLAQFTQRNCSRQMEWFIKAIRGDFVKQAAPTFQEMQDLIDESRRAGCRQ